MDVEEQWKVIRREGEIVSRIDVEKEEGMYTFVVARHNGILWFCIMLNGLVVRLEK